MQKTVSEGGESRQASENKAAHNHTGQQNTGLDGSTVPNRAI